MSSCSDVTPRNYWLYLRLDSCFRDLHLPLIRFHTDCSELFDLVSVFAVSPAAFDEVIVDLHYCVDSLLAKAFLYSKGTHFFEAKGPLNIGQVKTILRNLSFIVLKNSKYSLMHGLAFEKGTSGSFFLLVGGSGVGKSTYGKSLSRLTKGSVLINDYALVSRGANGDLLASDINFSSSLAHREPLKIVELVILRKDSAAEVLDVSRISTANLDFWVNTIWNSLDCLHNYSRVVKKLNNFWGSFGGNLSAFLISSHRFSVEKTLSLISKLILVEDGSKRVYSAGVVGLGAVGSQISFQLLNWPSVGDVALYSRTQSTRHGLALDLSDAAALIDHRPAIWEANVFEEMLACDFLVLCFRDTISELNVLNHPKLNLEDERLLKVAPHLRIIYDFAQRLRRCQYAGTVFVVTNPVEILTWYLYQLSNLNDRGEFDGGGLTSNQIYGIGLELDKGRAQQVMFRNYGSASVVSTYVQHGGDLTIEITDPEFLRRYPSSTERQVLTGTKERSSLIRQNISRTVYGPATAAIKTIRAVLTGGGDPVMVSCVLRDFSVGGPVRFFRGVPDISMLYSPDGGLRLDIGQWRLKFRQLVESINGSQIFDK